MFVITQREATDSGCIYDLDRRAREQTEEERSRERVERNRELRSNTEKWSTQELLSETLSSINLLSLLQKFWTLCPDKIQYKDARICFCGGTLEMKLLPSCFISSFIFINRPYQNHCSNNIFMLFCGPSKMRLTTSNQVTRTNIWMPSFRCYSKVQWHH